MKTILDAARAHGVEHPDHYKTEGFTDGAMSVMAPDGQIDWMHLVPAAWGVTELGSVNMPTVGAIDDIMNRCAWALKLPRQAFQKLSTPRPASSRKIYMIQGGEHPEQENLECECWPSFDHDDGTEPQLLPAGILFDAERTGDDHTCIMRCDDCSIFEDDPSAATFLASILGEPWLKDFDDESDLGDEPTEDEMRAQDAKSRPYRPYFPRSPEWIINKIKAWHVQQARLAAPGLVANFAPGDLVDRSHGPTPSEEDVLVRDGLRSALIMLRDAIDEAEIADHVPSVVLDVVDLILAKTEA